MVTTIDRAMEEAIHIGLTHGTNAGEWFVGEVIFGAPEQDKIAVAVRYLDGTTDRDSEVLDALPAPDLSGEWADGYTPARLAEDCGLSDEQEDWQDVLPDLCDAYEEAFTNSVHRMVRVSCLLVLGQAS